MVGDDRVHAGAPDAPAGAVFSEDFENDASWSSRWEMTQGSCQMALDASSVLTCVNGDNEARVYATGQSFADFTVTARVRIHQIDDGKRIYLAGRFTDSNNWYGAALYNSGTRKVQIRKKVNGSSSDIASVDHPFENDVWYTLTFSMSGTGLSLSLDGLATVDGMDADFTTGSIALLADSAEVSWDDVTVTVP